MKAQLKALWRGEVSFPRYFFLYFGLSHLCYLSAWIFVLLALGHSSFSPEEGKPYVALLSILFLSTIWYFPLSSVGVVRSALKNLAGNVRILTIIGLTPLIIISTFYTFIIAGVFVESLLNIPL